MKSIKNLLFVLLAIFLLISCQQKDKVLNLNDLTCENRINPVGIDQSKPQLSWIIQGKDRGIKQGAYQVLVASSEEILKKNEGDLWNSSKIESSQSVFVDYAGKPLESGTNCFWKVRVWDNNGNESSWSEPANWSMGLLKQSDWKAKWIGLDKIFKGDEDTAQFRKLAARYLRKEFEITKDIKRATAYISGLGLYELHINGAKTGEMVLAPGATQYKKKAFYNTFDITSQVKTGKNAIGVVLGNGRFFAMRKDNPFKMENYGFPKLIMQAEIEYTDGTKDIITSDESWKITANGPITENNEFDGEKYDARKELSGWDLPGFDVSKWLEVELVAKPCEQLTAQLNEPIKVTGFIKPISVNKLKPDVFIFDMGQNMVGWAKLSVKGKVGDKVKMVFAETLKKDGSLYLDNLRSAKVTDIYTLKGGETETWEPKFTYHGFRYVEITGYPGTPDLEAITGCIVNDDVQTSGTFECSNEVINQVYKNAVWGIRGNYRSMPTDCPQRDERMGWLGDRATGCRGESYIFNNYGLYRKWMGDMRDDQSPEGSIPDLSPAYWHLYNDNITWDGAGIMVTQMLYEQYGSVKAVSENYETLKKWLFYMKDKYMINNLMPRDTYGDWCMPPEDPKMIHSQDPDRITESVLLGTSFFYHDTRIMQDFAKLLDKPEDEKAFTALADSIKTAYNNNFFVPAMNYYSNNTVTANILSLAFGLAPDDKKQAIFNNIVWKIETDNNGHIPVGLIGIMYLQRILTEYGRPDIALGFASKTEYPSWGYMAKNGATTIWELWNGNTADPAMNSGNHVMLLGDFNIWLYENMGGIKPAEPGFKTITMDPVITEDVNFVKSSHKTPYGLVKSEWEYSDKIFSWNIEIPCNTKAFVSIPASDKNEVFENNSAVDHAQGVKFLEMKDGKVVFEVMSGSYRFVSKNFKLPKTDYRVSAPVKIFPKDTAANVPLSITLSCIDKDAEIRYTTDNTDPDEKSSLYHKPFPVAVSTIVKARSFKKDVKPAYLTRRNYDIFDAVKNGLNFEYFEGKWTKIPDYNAMKPLRTGKVNGFILSNIKTTEDYWGIRFKGFIDIKKDGGYIFSTVSDDGSWLLIDDKMVLDNDGVHGPFTVQGKVDLKAGKHAFILDFFEGNYGEILKVYISSPDMLKQEVPVSMLYFNK